MECDLLHGFRLGEWRVYPERNCIVSDGRELHLEGKIMAVLVYLCGKPRQVVPKFELLDKVWPNQAVAEGVLTRAVYELRRMLDDDAGKPRYIENVPRLGYRLLERPQVLDSVVNRPSRRMRRRLKTVSATAMVLAATMLAYQLLTGYSGSPRIRSVGFHAVWR